jgi:hypothetical protein
MDGFKEDDQIQPPPRRFFLAKEGGGIAAGIYKLPAGIGHRTGDGLIQSRDEFRPDTPKLGMEPKKKQHLYHGKFRYSIPDVYRKDKPPKGDDKKEMTRLTDIRYKYIIPI